MKTVKILLLFFLFVNLSFAKEKIYLMPEDSKKAVKAVLKEIDSAKSTIDVAIYSFTRKDFAKALRDAAKRGVKVTIITNEKDAGKRNKIGYLAKYKNVEPLVVKGRVSRSGKYYGKMHLKLAIIDGKKAIHGSANWSHSAFGLNYETLIITDSKKYLEKFTEYYKELKASSKEF